MVLGTLPEYLVGERAVAEAGEASDGRAGAGAPVETWKAGADLQ